MNNENILILKYENLISKPTKEIQNICNFLNVKFSKKYLNLDLLKDINNKKWKINSVHASSKIILIKQNCTTGKIILNHGK